MLLNYHIHKTSLLLLVEDDLWFCNFHFRQHKASSFPFILFLAGGNSLTSAGLNISAHPSAFTPTTLPNLSDAPGISVPHFLFWGYLQVNVKKQETAHKSKHWLLSDLTARQTPPGSSGKPNSWPAGSNYSTPCTYMGFGSKRVQELKLYNLLQSIFSKLSQSLLALGLKWKDS